VAVKTTPTDEGDDGLLIALTRGGGGSLVALAAPVFCWKASGRYYQERESHREPQREREREAIKSSHVDFIVAEQQLRGEEGGALLSLFCRQPLLITALARSTADKGPDKSGFSGQQEWKEDMVQEKQKDIPSP